MEHMAWKGRIKPGCKAEYQRRHAEIWPEMVKVLKEAGICNYSIFYCKDELFGYYECEKGVAYAEKVQAESPIVDRWNEYMKDILELEICYRVCQIILNVLRNAGGIGVIFTESLPCRIQKISAHRVLQQYVNFIKINPRCRRGIHIAVSHYAHADQRIVQALHYAPYSPALKSLRAGCHQPPKLC